MKICWDNLEKLKYRPDFHGGVWQLKKSKNRHYYIFKEFCECCGFPFLSRNGKGIFCDYSCAKTNFQHSKKSKEKSRVASLGKKQSIETIKKRIKKGKDHYNWKGGVTEKDIVLYDTFAGKISFCEPVRRNKNVGGSKLVKQIWKNLDVLEVKCAYCGKWFAPARFQITNRIRALDNFGSESRLYCSENCKKECPIYNQKLYPKGFKSATSREVQPELRQMCFERDNYTCQKCGKTKNELDVGLHCHHVEGIRWEPLESADLDKVITFCKTCHKEVHKQPDCGYHDMRCKEK
jgi:hypothetical protein